MINFRVRNTSAIALLLVLVTIVVVVIVANAALRLMLNQYRLSHHQTSRVRAYYASLAGMNLALEKIRLNEWPPSPEGGAITYGCINGCIDATPTYTLIQDTDIPYNVQIAIYPFQSGLSRIEIKTEYTYQKTSS